MAGHRARASIRPEAQLFEAHALRLRAVVSRSVRTSPVNVEDACGFAWLQLLRRQPPAAATFAWLRTTAIREAVKLHRRAAETVSLDEATEVVRDRRNEPDRHLELIIAGEEIRAARLRPREARLLGLCVAGYGREEMVELTGDSHRTVDRHLGRAQRKLNAARHGKAEVG